MLKSKFLQHLIFWCLSLFAIGTYFSISSTLSTIDFIYSFFFHICLLTLVYTNLHFLVPRFFEKKRFRIYGISLVALIGLSLLLHDLIFDLILPNTPIDFYIVSFTDRILLIQIFLIYLVVTTLFHLSASWFQIQHLQKDKLHIELNALKAQLNPHFLFNGLNSIYSLALKRHEETPAAILKLSELLRYSLYEAGDEKVSVSKETEEIKNYIDIQRLRLEKDVDIRFQTTGNHENKTVTPMLFLPILENAFKHGPKGTSGGFIRVSMKISNSEINFSCINSIVKSGDPGNEAGGIGLENLAKRLQLLYPDQHSLIIDPGKDKFVVTLKIEA